MTWRRPSATLGVVLMLAALVAGCSRQPSDYGSETETVFLRACTAGGAEPARDDKADGVDLDKLCRCSYRRIKAEIPYDDYVKIEEQLDKKSDEPPDKIVDIVAACGAEASATTTTRKR